MADRRSGYRVRARAMWALAACVALVLCPAGVFGRSGAIVKEASWCFGNAGYEWNPSSAEATAMSLSQEIIESNENERIEGDRIVPRSVPNSRQPLPEGFGYLILLGASIGASIAVLYLLILRLWMGPLVSLPCRQRRHCSSGRTCADVGVKADEVGDGRMLAVSLELGCHGGSLKGSCSIATRQRLSWRYGLDRARRCPSRRS